MSPVKTMKGVPLWKPPYGRVTAIDLNTGDHRWMTPVGDLADEVPALKVLGLKNLGRPARGHLLLTKSILIIGQEGSTQREGGNPSNVPKFQIVTPNLIALDKSSGKRVGEVALPHNATAAPMTYMHKGKQFLVVATGGANFPAELIALSL
jgi:quinoprotein glucose dehydrogenase